MDSTTSSCSVCRHGRCQIKLFPCQHVAHARCIYPWPISSCPLCHVEVEQVTCLEIQEYSYLSESCVLSDTSKVFCPLRETPLTSAEIEYLDAVVASFKTGMCPFEEGISLPYVACSALLCMPSRLCNKRLNAKLLHQSKPSVTTEVSEIVNYLKLQVKLSLAEDRFLKSIALANGLEDASIVAYHIQHFWLTAFIRSNGGRSHNLLQMLPSISHSTINVGAFSVADHMIGSLYRGDAHVDGLNRRVAEYFNLAPFDLGICYTISTNRIHCSTFSFQELQKINPDKLSTSAAGLTLAIFNNLFTSPTPIFNALLNTIPGAGYAEEGYHEEIKELVPSSTLPSPWLPFVRRVFHRWVPRMEAMNGSILSMCSVAIGVHFVSDDVALAIISFQRLPPNVEIDLDLVSSGEEPMPVPRSNGVLTATECTRVAMAAESRLLDNGNNDSFGDNGGPRFSISDDSDRGNDMSDLFPTSGKSRVPEIYKRRRIVSDGDMDASKLSTARWSVSQPEKIFDWTSKMLRSFDSEVIVSPSKTALNPYAPPIVDNAMGKILKTCLTGTPFQLIELWFPVKINGKTILLFGGSATNNELLHGWSVYSRGFSFEENSGIPGRIASDLSIEKYSDVGMLPSTKFLRSDGARQLGLRASVGIPLLQSAKVIEASEDAEIGEAAATSSAPIIAVLYSIEAFPVTADIVELCQRKLNGLSISSGTNTVTVRELNPAKSDTDSCVELIN